MFVAVCYDVADDHRRRRLAGILEGFGRRAQKIVFEMLTGPGQFADLMKAVKGAVDEREDRVRFYVLCARCVGQCPHQGGEPIAAEPLCYVI